MTRTSIKIAGESGMGLLSVGMILAKALKRMGFYIVMDREYPSLIKGGHSNVQIDLSVNPIYALSSSIDVVVALDKAGLEEYINLVKEGGILIHGYEQKEKIKQLEESAEARKVKLLYLPARKVAHSFGGNELMVNMVLMGMLWRVFGFDKELILSFVREQFASKPKLLEIDINCVNTGYSFSFEDITVEPPRVEMGQPVSQDDLVLIDGNMAIALGAIHCGVRAYYAYPMSPASTILTHISNFAADTKMVVKQAEDEITAAQMALGSMSMGTRAFTSTSGGGFDLMTETVSLAGITETPLVVVIAQRPGPATGLPTWTAQADLQMAIHSGHGEYSKIVVACSDPQSCFELIQHAMNLAEKYQTVVLLLTEKVIAETQISVRAFEQNTIEIERGLVSEERLATVKSADRFAITESGLSERWLPCSNDQFYFANGDEHRADGTLTELEDECGDMYAKRVRKMKLIERNLPEPEIYGGETDADISFVGWGSSKGVMLDVIALMAEQGVKVNYLHYEYLFPLKIEALKSFIGGNKNVVLIEGNFNGQLGDLIYSKLQEDGVNFRFQKKFLKYNGRPFFVEEVIKFINHN